MNRNLCFLMMFIFAGSALATTWTSSELTDPLTGEKVPCKTIMSYGSYIYNWPSKYDLVFWPLTDENWICFNPKNGYAAFNDDFEKISDEEKAALTTWLAQNYKVADAPKSYEEKLAWLEKVYHQRNMDDEFWCRFYRLMAYIHEDNQEVSIGYVKKALPLLEATLKTKPVDIDRIEVLFLLGEYNRRIGKAEKAKEYFEQVKSAKYKDDKGKKKVGHPYFVELVEDREQLMKEEAAKKAIASEGEQSLVAP